MEASSRLKGLSLNFILVSEIDAVHIIIGHHDCGGTLEDDLTSTLLSHGAKVGARALVNTSPEPVSNIVVSSGEDVVTGGALIATLASPVAAGLVAILLLASAIFILTMLRRLLRSGSGRAMP